MDKDNITPTPEVGNSSLRLEIGGGTRRVAARVLRLAASMGASSGVITEKGELSGQPLWGGLSQTAAFDLMRNIDALIDKELKEAGGLNVEEMNQRRLFKLIHQGLQSFVGTPGMSEDELRRSLLLDFHATGYGDIKEEDLDIQPKPEERHDWPSSWRERIAALKSPYQATVRLLDHAFNGRKGYSGSTFDKRAHKRLNTQGYRDWLFDEEHADYAGQLDDFMNIFCPFLTDVGRKRMHEALREGFNETVVRLAPS